MSTEGVHARDRRSASVNLVPPGSLGLSALFSTCRHSLRNVSYSVRMHNTAWLNGLLDERTQAVRGCVLDLGHPYPPGASSIFLCSNSYQRLLLRLPSSDPLPRSTQVSLVHLHSPRQSVTPGADHGPPQLVQPSPRGLVASQPEDPLHPQGAGACLQGRYPPHHSGPHDQGLTRTVEDGPGYHRRLVRTTCALNQHPAYAPPFRVPAPGTQVAVRPAQLEEVIQARLFRGEPGLELSKCPGNSLPPRNTTCGMDMRQVNTPVGRTDEFDGCRWSKVARGCKCKTRSPGPPCGLRGPA